LGIPSDTGAWHYSFSYQADDAMIGAGFGSGVGTAADSASHTYAYTQGGWLDSMGASSSLQQAWSTTLRDDRQRPTKRSHSTSAALSFDETITWQDDGRMSSSSLERPGTTVDQRGYIYDSRG